MKGKMFKQILLVLMVVNTFSGSLEDQLFTALDQKDAVKKVNEKTLPDFDILCAGFPCNSFSNAGKKGHLVDPRGTLFEDILRIASEKRPKFMFLENVKHIKKIDNGN